MKKLRLKSLLSLFLLFFLSFGCEQQVDTPEKLTASELLKDRDFLSFMEVAEEMRYKVLQRQSDLVIFAKGNGVYKPDFNASLRNADNSFEKIKQWGQTKESAIKNKNLIVKELGFDSQDEYDQLEQEIEKRRGTLTAKYPNILTMPSEERRKLLTEVVEKWGSNAKTSTGEWNTLCPNCFFNNCNSCGTGEGKAENPPRSGGGCDQLMSCERNKATIRDASKNIALVVFLEYLVASCGSAALSGFGYGATFGGPQQGGVLLGGLAFAGCGLVATLIYTETLRLIDATYRDGLLDCQEKFKC